MACALTWTVRQFRAVSAGHQRSVATDDKTKAHGQDLERINVNQDYEPRDWSKKLGVTPEELKALVPALSGLDSSCRSRGCRPQRNRLSPASCWASAPRLSMEPSERFALQLPVVVAAFATTVKLYCRSACCASTAQRSERHAAVDVEKCALR